MSEPSQPRAAVFSVHGAKKRFGAVRALNDVDFAIHPGECVGLVGHNGAGKSTLVNVINGGLSPDEGAIALVSGPLDEGYSIRLARATGIRCVFQELSMCPNLSVTENVRIAHPGLGGFGWRKRARALISAQLDTMFPGHGVECASAVGNLSIAQRQMVEIAIAFSSPDNPVSLVILDEPTSSLDASRAQQLIAYLKSYIANGGAAIFISHILGEILEVADRIVVMRDGQVVSERPSTEFTVEGLVQAMGSVAAKRQARRTLAARAAGEAPAVSFPRADDLTPFCAYSGEIVGLAGLSGHGQTDLLVDLYMQRTGDWRAKKTPDAVFVAGDRLVDGIFPVWSILRNMSLTALPHWVRFGILGTVKELGFGRDWYEKVGIRTDNLDNSILSLSGGNQQKTLFARALGSQTDLVLMDDPMRGVDIGTKQDVYALLRSEAENGRCFVWYSTEMDEVCVCDRVYVFREGRIVAELEGDSVTEENILAASFGERAA